jgi:hypothetical protein
MEHVVNKLILKTHHTDTKGSKMGQKQPKNFNDQKSKIMIITRKKPRINGASKFISIIRNYNKKTR